MLDPIVAAAQIITALQTIASRSLNPLEGAVVSVCQVDAGTAFNIIPQEAVLSGTIRTFKPDVNKKVRERFETIVQKTAEAMGCQAEISMERITLPVANDPQLDLAAGKGLQGVTLFISVRWLTECKKIWIPEAECYDDMVAAAVRQMSDLLEPK